MLFNSYPFLLVFLPAAILIYSLVDRFSGARTWVMIGLSLVFYSYWDVRFLPLMMTSILFNWLVAKFFGQKKKPIIITAAIVANLLVLGIFKYTNFVAGNFAALFEIRLAGRSILLPLGISFFTFHHIMYLADLRRGRAPLYPLDRYALYICFFPQAISGPIARWNEVIDQFGRTYIFRGLGATVGGRRVFIVIGLIQKTAIADPLAAILDPIYAQAASGW